MVIASTSGRSASHAMPSGPSARLSIYSDRDHEHEDPQVLG